MNVHADARRVACFDIFPEMPTGQINLVRLHHGQFCGWHRHQRQIDYYFCISGTVKVGTMTPNGTQRWKVLESNTPEVLSVPEQWWHGYEAVGGDAILLQYIDNKYDPLRPDEERLESLP